MLNISWINIVNHRF